MTRSVHRRASHALLAALALGACGPYAQLGQKLDVIEQFSGDSWIAAAGADRSETRILTLEKPGGNHRFAFSALQLYSVVTLHGTWTESAGGQVELRVEHTFTFPDERWKSVSDRFGAQRDDGVHLAYVTVSRSGGQLVITGGDPGFAGIPFSLAGTYVGLPRALSRLGTATEHDAACAYQVASLAVHSSEARIKDFGSARMTQYATSGGARFVGTLAGYQNVSLSGFTSVTTTIRYSGFSDQEAIVLDGTQYTDANLSGNGHMHGAVSFTLSPVPLDPASAATLAPITASIDYGGAGTSSDAVQITNGNPTGGFYVTTLAGGPTARIPALNVTATSPSVADCLSLP